MRATPSWHHLKRIVAMAVAGSMVLQTMSPAFARVSQSPGIYVAQPDSNVMFTLDDSGSMNSDVIPDLPTDVEQFPAQNVANVQYTYLNGGWICLERDWRNRCTREGWGSPNGTKFPLMWRTGSGFRAYAYYSGLDDTSLSSDVSKRARVTRFLRSSAGNPLYYDRTVTYTPWPTAADDKVLMANASTNAVNIDQDDARTNTETLNLRNAVTSGTNTYYPATYFIYNGSTALSAQNIHDTSANVQANFTKVEIRPDVATYTRAAQDERTDCGTGATCTYEQELQNFANWLQYYHSRMLTAKGGVAAAFARQQTNLRVGFATLNSSDVVRLGVRQFQGADRSAIYTDLYNRPASGGTPLREAMDKVGIYFQTTDVSNPWAFTPGTTQSPEYDCRRSFHILSTDGFWNGNAASGSGADNTPSADNDNFSGLRTPAKPDGTDYAYSDTATSTNDPLVSRFTINPFRDNTDSQGNRLSDVAAYYWRTDLRSNIPNRVSSTARDPAFWQHLTTFTVGLGITGTGTVTKISDGTAANLSNPAVLIADKTALNWPDVSAESRTTGDDLIRSAMVGRGRYFSATNPRDLSNGLASALSEATDQPLSLSNLAASSARLTAGSKIYQATFSPDRWYGRLYAFSQNATTGTVNTTPSSADWEASQMMPAPNDRNIYTWDGAASAPSTFTWTGLNSTQQGHLNNDSTLLDYLRGSDLREARNNGPFRDRARNTPAASRTTSGVLGDVVNGSPIKATESGVGYDRLPNGTPGKLLYGTYRSSSNANFANLLDTIFLSANDGMLHAFNRSSGEERFAYVPNSVFSVPRSISGTEHKLRMMSDPAYQHRFTVDGPPQLSDAFFGPDDATGKWRTVLNASTGAGARSIFLMDVTNPVVGTTTDDFRASNILWEFSEANNIDMGYILSYGHVARMKNGRWALIFGNGYDSTNGQAKLFILDLYTGAVIKEIAVGNSGRGNGLSQPNFTLRDRVVEYIYAGDLQGNLWKFDVTSDDPNNWVAAFSSTPLYTTSTNQPITVMPAIGMSHPNGGNLLIFGTGKFFEEEDTSGSSTLNVNLTRQAIYGIWDKPSETTGFSGTTLLAARSMNTGLAAAADASLSGTGTGTVNWSTQRGWYLPLNTGGERVNVNPQLPFAQNPLSPAFVVANTPAEAVPCLAGGTARIFALDPYTGSAPLNAVFDANRSGTITSADRGYNVWSVNSGVMTQPLFQATGSTGVGTSGLTTSAQFWDDGRTGGRDGGREQNNVATPSGPCTANVTIGLSDTSTTSKAASLCPSTSGRISWRQIQ